MSTFVIRGEFPQRNAMGGYGSEWQSDAEFSSLDEARQVANDPEFQGQSFNIRIHQVQGDNGAEYPLVEQVK